MLSGPKVRSTSKTEHYHVIHTINRASICTKVCGLKQLRLDLFNLLVEIFNTTRGRLRLTSPRFNRGIFPFLVHSTTRIARRNTSPPILANPRAATMLKRSNSIRPPRRQMAGCSQHCPLRITLLHLRS